MRPVLFLGSVAASVVLLWNVAAGQTVLPDSKAFIAIGECADNAITGAIYPGLWAEDHDCLTGAARQFVAGPRPDAKEPNAKEALQATWQSIVAAVLNEKRPLSLDPQKFATFQRAFRTYAQHAYSVASGSDTNTIQRCAIDLSLRGKELTSSPNFYVVRDRFTELASGCLRTAKDMPKRIDLFNKNAMQAALGHQDSMRKVKSWRAAKNAGLTDNQARQFVDAALLYTDTRSLIKNAIKSIKGRFIEPQ